MIRFTAFISAVIMSCQVVRADSLLHAPRVGDVYEITMDRESSSHDSNGSSGSSSDRDTLSERVIMVREDGLELEYDLPKDATVEDRASSWHFPARVFKPLIGPTQLLNEPELEARVDPWLKAAKWTRDACGRWIFTWNAFRIDCEPQSVIAMINGFDLRPSDLRDGGPYHDSVARGSAVLVKKPANQGGSVFVAQMVIDPDRVRRDRADAAVAIAQLSGKTLALDVALRAEETADIAGKITITFETDFNGSVRRRTRVTEMTIKGTDGKPEYQTVTETVERRLITPLTPHPARQNRPAPRR